MRRKGILSKILLMLMVIMVVPTTAFAANEGVTTEVIKDGVLTELNTKGESYEVPSGVVKIGGVARYLLNASNLKKLVIGEGVKEIGALAFSPTQAKPKNLETVEMKDVEIIGEFAFAGLDKLKSVTLSDNLKEIKVNAFSKTKSLTSIKLPEGLEKIGSEAFAWSGLTSIEIPGTVKKLEQLTFEMNSSLTKVVINEGLEEIAGGAFEKCYNLTEVHIPASVKKMGVGAFSKSGNLTIHTPKGSYAEDYAKKNGIKVANDSTTTTKPEPTPTQPTQPTKPESIQPKPTLTNEPKQPNLSKTVIINEGVKEEIIENGVLKKLYTTGTSYETPISVTKIDSGINITAENLKSLIIGKGIKEIDWDSFYRGAKLNFKKLETLEMKDVEIISWDGFEYFVELKNVILSSNLKVIGIGSFRGTTSLELIKIPYGVELIGIEAFRESGLKSIEIPGSVKTIEMMAFSRIGNLEKVVIQEGVEKIGKRAFDECMKLKYIYLPESINDMEYDVFLKSDNVIIHTPKGSYADLYARYHGIKVENVGVATSDVEFIPKDRPDPFATGIRGFMPVENLVGVQKEKIEFGLLKHKPYINGTYEVELWDDNTTQEVIYTNLDHFILETGYLIKINGKFYAANGLVNGNLDDEIGKVETRYDGTGVWYSKTLRVPEKVEIQPYDPYGGIFSDGKKYTKYSPEVYAYYVYDYEGRTSADAVFGGFYEDQNLKLKVIKYVKNGSIVKPTQPSLPSKVTTVATPTASKVTVNGKVVNFDAYLINGNNYFKLRDMATVVGETTKQFEVGWNQVAKVIDLISGKPYTAVGGELAKGDGKPKTGTLNTSKIFKDGKEVKLEAYTINGNNYFKLRDLAQAFDIGVTWDNVTKTVGIDTSIGYTIE